jgi:hypothetical protein
MEKGSTTMNLTPPKSISTKRLIHHGVPEMQKEGDAGANHGKEIRASRSAQRMLEEVRQW